MLMFFGEARGTDSAPVGSRTLSCFAKCVRYWSRDVPRRPAVLLRIISRVHSLKPHSEALGCPARTA